MSNLRKCGLCYWLKSCSCGQPGRKHYVCTNPKTKDRIEHRYLSDRHCARFLYNRQSGPDPVYTDKNDRRKNKRIILEIPISAWVPAANKFYNGRTLNVSRSGALIKCIRGLPIKPGDQIEINFALTRPKANVVVSFTRVMNCRVTRKFQQNIKQSGNFIFAVCFEVFK